jgi:hypothetical protein
MDLRDQEQVHDSEEDESTEKESEDLDGDSTSSMDEGDESEDLDVEEGGWGIRNLNALGPGGRGPWCCYTVVNGRKISFAWFATAEEAREHVRELEVKLEEEWRLELTRQMEDQDVAV